MDELGLFGSAFVASLLVALACSLLGVHVVARRLIAVGVALPQMAALGIACSFLLAGTHAEDVNPLRHDGMALLLEMLGVGALAWGARSRSIGLDTLAGVLFVGASAVTILLMMQSAQGLDEVRNLVEGNILAVRAPELARVAAALVPVVVLVTLGGRRLMLCSFDRETAATLGVLTGAWEFAFYAALALTIAAGVHATGTLFVFGFLVLPGASGIVLARSAAGVVVTSVTVGLAGAAVGFHLSYAWDAPTGPACVATGLVLFAACAAAGWLRNRLVPV